MQFDVWAPLRESVGLDLNGRVHPMEKDERGWWHAEVPDAGPGTDYAFRLDGGPPRPDPRSPWQPNGVHKPSRTLDHSTFTWTDRRWQARPISSAVIYELHVGTFTPQGTFTAVLDRLDHLVEVGVSHVELMPVAQFLGQYGWGYDGVELFAPHNGYGTPDDLKRLIDGCHAAGLGVLLDVVYNHLGPSGNYLAEFAPYFTERHQTPWGWAVNFDGPYSDEVRRYFCDNAVMWLRDYHFDGLRLDAVHAIIDTSARPFLEQLSEEVDSLEAHLGRHFSVIAESDMNNPQLVRSRPMGGYGLDAHWSDDVHHALHSALTLENAGYYRDFGTMAQLATVAKNPYVYSGKYSTFRGRSHGRPPTGLVAANFVVCIQNHDQVGNRAKGDRIGQIVSQDRAKVGAALNLLSPFVPLLFQGEEWNASSPFQYFVNFDEEPELAEAVSEGRPKEFLEFGWDPKDIPDPNATETFQRSKLPWNEIDGPKHAEMLDWYKRLIALRRELPELTNGQFNDIGTRFDESEGWLAIERGPTVIACNLSRDPQTVCLPRCAPMEIRLASQPGIELRVDGLLLPPDSVAVLRRTAQGVARP